jgi:hypothetical protein
MKFGISMLMIADPIGEAKTNPRIDQPEAGSADSPLTIRELGHWSLVVAVNNDQVLQRTLLASPAIDARCQVITKRGFPCVGKAYNAGIAEAQHDIIVFAHQDIYLPRDWMSHIELALSRLAVEDPNWGVLGLVGVVKNPNYEVRGYCYSTGLQRYVGEPFSGPVEVRSLDEIVLIIRRSSGLFFDDNMPGFHLYGTDICLEAEKRKMKNYATSAFCIHNTNGIKRLPIDFWRAYFYLRHKWWDRLPVTTSCTTITKSCGPMALTIARDLLRTALRTRRVGCRTDDVGGLYQHLAQDIRNGNRSSTF